MKKKKRLESMLLTLVVFLEQCRILGELSYRRLRYSF